VEAKAPDILKGNTHEDRTADQEVFTGNGHGPV
jgi:hypothetical protein